MVNDGQYIGGALQSSKNLAGKVGESYLKVNTVLFSRFLLFFSMLSSVKTLILGTKNVSFVDGCSYHLHFMVVFLLQH